MSCRKLLAAALLCLLPFSAACSNDRTQKVEEKAIEDINKSFEETQRDAAKGFQEASDEEAKAAAAEDASKKSD